MSFSQLEWRGTIGFLITKRSYSRLNAIDGENDDDLLTDGINPRELRETK